MIPLLPNAPGPNEQPLFGQDPRSQYLAQALQSMQQAQPQGPVAAGSDLLAQALLQYGQNRMSPNLNGQVMGSGYGPVSALDTNVDPLQGGVFFGG